MYLNTGHYGLISYATTFKMIYMYVELLYHYQ